VKIAGRKIEGANIETVVFPRSNAEDIVLQVQAVLDFSDFEKLCPIPKPPVVVRRGGEKSYNVEDANYSSALMSYTERRTAWLILTSLRLATPDLEWETVDFGNPDTWTGYVDELRGAGFTDAEIIKLVQAVMTANSLDDNKLEAARARFLAGRGARLAHPSSPKAEPNITPSGELPSDLG
jgi:hypothetical protein